MGRPSKITWPIEFEEMLRYSFAKKRPEDRLKFYRLFLRDFLNPQTTSHALSEEIETALVAARQKKFDENTAYRIRQWSQMSFERWKRENITKRMSKMAFASWSDKARKKRKKKTNLAP